MSTALSPHPDAVTTEPPTPDGGLPFPVTEIEGLPLAVATYREILDTLEQRIRARQQTFCVMLNLDILRLACQSPDFHQVCRSADLIFADGMPILWLSRLRASGEGPTTPLRERIPGCDIVYDLCVRSHVQGYRLFFLGAAPGVAEQARRRLESQWPNIQVVGTYAPSPQELVDPDLSAAIVAQINDTQPDILFVALGAPKQEQWIARHRADLTATVMIPCGGSIDFIAGVQQKSPKWVGRLGLEWLFRMAFNPKRLFDRYVMKDLPFLVQCFKRRINLFNHSIKSEFS